MIWQIMKQEANSVSHKKFAYESEQGLVVTKLQHNTIIISTS